MAGPILPPVCNGPQKSAPVYKGPHMGLSWPIYGPQIGAAVRICVCRSFRRFFDFCRHRRPRFDVASARPGDDVLINAVCTGLIDTGSSRPQDDLYSMEGFCLGYRPKVKCSRLVIDLVLNCGSQVSRFQSTGRHVRYQVGLISRNSIGDTSARWNF